MGLVPCLVVSMLAIHNVAGLGAPTPVASLDAKQQEIVDFAVVQLQVNRARGWELFLHIIVRVESTGRAGGSPGWRSSVNR